MTLVLELPDNKEAALKARAQAHGVSAEQYAQNVLDRALAESLPGEPRVAQSVAGPEMNPEEWVRQFQAWTRSLSPDNLPLLSAEAISRDAIYGERGL